MFTATVTMADGSTEQREIRSVYDVELPQLRFEPRGRGAKKSTPDYYDAICCLDTETSKSASETLIHDQSVTLVHGVWIYQWCVGINDTLIAGRTADELLQLLHMLVQHYELDETRHLVIWVHNLAYDASYVLNGLWKMFEGQVEMFATGQRRPIRIDICKGLELRCSYKLVNKSLASWCVDAAPIPHKKLVGAIDYNVLRTPETELTSEDWDYMINDVLCQQDCLRVTLRYERLRTVPMTSTGFVRRAMRNAAKKDKSWSRSFKNQLPTAEQYLMMREAFIGGYAHCNSLAMGIWHNITGVDAASMYPAGLATEMYPIGKWYWREIYKYKDLRKQIWREDEATICKITFENLRLRDFADWRPYLPYSKAVAIAPRMLCTLDNGKIIHAPRATFTLCDLDLRIVFEQYTFDKLLVHKCMTCRRGPLPDWFKDEMRKWYIDKVQLKTGPEGETETERVERLRRYAESKERLNAIYGMCATAWTHDTYKFDFTSQEWSVPESKHDLASLREAIDAMRAPWSKQFLRYDWGLYCTAWARTHLWHAMECCEFPLYTDTDSVKGGDWDYDKLADYNRFLRKASDAAGFTIEDMSGTPRPIGVFEPDGQYRRFSALHAKCYAYEDEATGELHCTIAGVTASNGLPPGHPGRITKEDELGSLEELVDGKVFKACGGTRAVYIDNEHDVTVNGLKIHSYGGCAILDTTYEIGGVNDLIAMYALSDPDNPYK